MERDIRLEEVSDGKLYGLNDMVRADCGDCEGCSACCSGMGSSILLDPLDITRISQAVGQSFEEMLDNQIELNMVDGLILPNLKLHKDGESCVFLNERGRCSIHGARPGICRLFPLGRFYEGGTFQYFLQIHECRKENRTKVKVKKWIDTPNLKDNQGFIADWHYFLKEVQGWLLLPGNEEKRREASLLILQWFYMESFDGKYGFYEQFRDRLVKIKEKLRKSILN